MLLWRRAKQASWLGSWPVTDAQRDAARADFQLRDVDTDGLSLTAATSFEELGLLLVAVACERLNESKPMILLPIEEPELQRFGAVDRTPDYADTDVETVNARHYSLQWPQVELHALSDYLQSRRRKVVRFQPAHIRAALCWIDATAVREGEARSFVLSVQARLQR